MRNFLLSLVFTAFALSISAQNTPNPYNNQSYDWKGVSGPGVVGVLALRSSPPAFFTIDAVTLGTAPTTCTFEVESSPDGTNWNSGTNSLSGPLSCAANGVLTTHFQGKAVRFIRINVTGETGGDVTTSILFFYTRGGSSAN